MQVAHGPKEDTMGTSRRRPGQSPAGENRGAPLGSSGCYVAANHVCGLVAVVLCSVLSFVALGSGTKDGPLVRRSIELFGPNIRTARRLFRCPSIYNPG